MSAVVFWTRALAIRQSRTRFYIGIRKIAVCQNRFEQRHSRLRKSERKPTGGSRRLVPRGKRQQGDVPGLLDGAGKAALVCGADTGEPARHDLAALGHKALQ